MYDTTYSASASASGEISPVVVIIYLVVVALLIVSMWKVFTKAGRPGWAALVPFYNIYILLQIAGRPAWWMLLYFVPFVNFVVSIIVTLDVAKAFGKSTAFAIFGLLLFPYVGFPMLAFGSATYTGSNPTNLSAAGTPPTPPVAPAA